MISDKNRRGRGVKMHFQAILPGAVGQYGKLTLKDGIAVGIGVIMLRFDHFFFTPFLC